MCSDQGIRPDLSAMGPMDFAIKISRGPCRGPHVDGHSIGHSYHVHDIKNKLEKIMRKMFERQYFSLIYMIQ